MSNPDEIARFCANVRRLREHAGLTQRELAELLATNPETIVLLENRLLTDAVDIGFLFRLSGLFGIDPSDLFRETE